MAAPNWRHNISLSMMVIAFFLLFFQLRFVQAKCSQRLAGVKRR
jgi:hypothetical protein